MSGDVQREDAVSPSGTTTLCCCGYDPPGLRCKFCEGDKHALCIDKRTLHFGRHLSDGDQ